MTGEVEKEREQYSTCSKVLQADLRGRLVSLELWSVSAEQEGWQAQTSYTVGHSEEGASLA